jgi:hypothetical protein
MDESKDEVNLGVVAAFLGALFAVFVLVPFPASAFVLFPMLIAYGGYWAYRGMRRERADR